MEFKWGSGYIELTERITQFFQPKKYNWLNFTLINISFEIDRMHGEFSFEFSLLGLDLYFVQIYNKKVSEAKEKEYSEAIKNMKPFGVKSIGEKIK